MIVNHSSNGIVTKTSDVPSNQLRIKASGKAFKAMIDSIYRDKPGSIVRELSTNALDAHRAAGNLDRPFIIHLPDVYEPYFSIRDFGCSMSPEQIRDVYSVLFESSKDKSNEDAGGYGLGGKNFLSYQDSGTIIAYLDGKKYNYVLMYDESGLPTMHDMGVEDTDEENGIYVEVAIKEGDHRLFHTAVEQQLRWLTVKPILNNNSSNISIKTPTFSESFGNFSTFDKSISNPGGFWIIQGQIGYHIDIKELSANIKNKTALEFFNAFNGGALYFNIGEIFVTLSREDIQYDSHTIKSVEKFISDVAPIMAKEISTKINGFSTIWEKMKYLNSDRSLYLVAKLAGIELKDSDSKVHGRNGKWQLDASFLVTQNSDFSFCRYVNGKRDYFTNGAFIHPEGNVEIIIRDQGRGAISKMKWYSSSSIGWNKIIYMIEHREGAEFVTEDIIKEIESKLAGLTLTRVSTLPEAPKNSYGKRGSPVVYKWYAGCDTSKISKWEKIYDEEDIENGHYVIFENYPHLTLGVDKSDLFRKAIESKIFDDKTPIYAIKSTKEKLFSDNVNFKTLDTKLDDIMEGIRKKYENQNFIKRYAIAKKILDDTNTILVSTNLIKIAKNDYMHMNLKESYLGKILRLNKTASNYVTKIDTKFTKKLKGLDEMFFKSHYLKEFSKVKFPKINLPKTDNIMKRYPQLSWLTVNNYYITNKDLSKQIIDYIKFTDMALTKDSE